MVRGSEDKHRMILARLDIERIADAVIADFRNETNTDMLGVCIDQLAHEYLGLRVTFEKLSNDTSFCGVTAYADTKFKVVVDGEEKIIHISKNQVILDSDFIEMGKVHERCAKRRFTLAHEVAHQILYQLESDETKAACALPYAMRTPHTVRELKTTEDWNEWQANALGAALLMPRKSVAFFMKAIKRVKEDEYCAANGLDPNVVTPAFMIDYFCKVFHVSRSAATIRLQHLGYLSKDNEQIIMED